MRARTRFTARRNFWSLETGHSMTAAVLDTGGNFRVGSVMSRAWEICSANFGFFFAITFVVALPNLVFLMGQNQPGNLGWIFAVTIFGGLILNTIGQAVLLFGAFQQLRGRPVQPAEALQRALARFLPLIGLGFLYGFGIGLGMVLLLVPGLFLLVRWSVVVPACVVEDLSPTASMRRSADLTKGHRWKIFGIMILLLIASTIGNKLVGLLLAPAGPVVAAFGVVIWTALWAAYWNCVLIMIYHDLRVAKEGIDTEQIAAVFD
jgi:Membrane domain of glycerophosphoryl diester phosphodiesterase